jgi:hypothetical protein
MERAWEVTICDGLHSQESRGRERRRGHGRLPRVMDDILRARKIVERERAKEGEGIGGYPV